MEIKKRDEEAEMEIKKKEAEKLELIKMKEIRKLEREIQALKDDEPEKIEWSIYMSYFISIIIETLSYIY